MSLHYHQRLVQVQEKSGEKYKALTTKGGHEILLVVSWYEGFLACNTLVAGAWTEREKMYHGGSFLKLADDNMDIQNPEAQIRELSGF